METTTRETSETSRDTTRAKLDALRALFVEMKTVLVCYSGGIDSAFLLAVAHQALGAQAVGMTAVSPSLAPFEREEAITVAKQIGARHELVDSNEIDDPNYAANKSDRCFHCKSELYRLSEVKRAEWGVAFVVNGTNLDDLGDYRPGLEAAKQAGVRSPLVELGMTKADVRACAAEIGLTIWDKPAAACLSSRLPYGTVVTRDRLARIAALEGELRRIGLRQVRVRWHSLGGDGAPAEKSEKARDAAIARIEVARDELTAAFDARDAIVSAGKRVGFAYVTLDLQGYRTGSHNEVLSTDTLGAGRKQLKIVS